MNDPAPIVVVGSGAGGGVIAGTLAARGHRVALFEAGPHRTARDFVRSELVAGRDLFWPVEHASTADPHRPIAMVAGRCVGGSTTVNGSVAIRPTADDLGKWAAATRPANDDGGELELADLDPHLASVEAAMGVRRRDDWNPAVQLVAAGFRRAGLGLEPLTAYTDHNCTGCGACLSGCPTNASRSTMVSYIHPAMATGNLEVHAEHEVTRVRFERSAGVVAARGVEFRRADGSAGSLDAEVVVVSAGALRTPALLLRSGLVEVTGGSPSSRQVGRHLGLHLARHVYGHLGAPLDLHRSFATTAACFDHLADEDGGFLLYACGTMDPIGLAVNLVDERFEPVWGERLTSWMRHYREVAGVIAMINDDNAGSVAVDDDGGLEVRYELTERDHGRMDAALAAARSALIAAGATDLLATGYLTAHVQGTCRMGAAPATAVVDSYGRCHDVANLYVGDASILPRTLSVGPSLTIMALAARMADHLDRDVLRPPG